MGVTIACDYIIYGLGLLKQKKENSKKYKELTFLVSKTKTLQTTVGQFLNKKLNR